MRGHWLVVRTFYLHLLVAGATFTSTQIIPQTRAVFAKCSLTSSTFHAVSFNLNLRLRKGNRLFRKNRELEATKTGAVSGRGVAPRALGN